MKIKINIEFQSTYADWESFKLKKFQHLKKWRSSLINKENVNFV